MSFLVTNIVLKLSIIIANPFGKYLFVAILFLIVSDKWTNSKWYRKERKLQSKQINVFRTIKKIICWQSIGCCWSRNFFLNIYLLISDQQPKYGLNYCTYRIFLIPCRTFREMWIPKSIPSPPGRLFRRVRFVLMLPPARSLAGIALIDCHRRCTN